MQTKAFYTAITTGNLEKTLDFYVNLLGFHVAHNITIPQGGRIAVLENDMGAKLDVIEVPGTPGGFHALRTNVADLDAAVAELKAKNWEILGGPTDISTGRTILVRDPNGVLIDISQHIRKNK